MPTYNIILEADLYARMKDHAFKSSKPLSSLVRGWIETGLGAHLKPSEPTKNPVGRPPKPPAQVQAAKQAEKAKALELHRMETEEKIRMATYLYESGQSYDYRYVRYKKWQDAWDDFNKTRLGSNRDHFFRFLMNADPECYNLGFSCYRGDNHGFTMGDIGMEIDAIEKEFPDWHFYDFEQENFRLDHIAIMRLLYKKQGYYGHPPELKPEDF